MGSSVRQGIFAILNQTLGYILEIELRCLGDELIWKMKEREELWMTPKCLALATG